MTRKDALTILNACFPVNIISYLQDAIDDSEHDFFVIQEQLLLAIMLDYNRCIWKSFIHDPKQFKKDYQETNFVNRTAKNAIAEFFKEERIGIPANVIPSVIPNTEKLKFGIANYNKNADQPSTGMYPVVSPFYEFWNLSCDIAEIPRNKRKSADYTPAKIDAFIYFNALYPFYGLDFNDWKPDIMKSKIEIFTRKQLAESFENPDGSTFEFVAMGGMKGEYFRCNLMDSIFDRCSWAIDNGADPNFKFYPNWNWRLDLPAALLFAPTSKIIKRILSEVLAEQSRAIQTVISDNDFSGKNWVDADTDSILKNIAKGIISAQGETVNTSHTKVELELKEPYKTAVDNHLIKPIGHREFSPLMALGKMLFEWNRIWYDQNKTTIFPYCRQFHGTIVHDVRNTLSRRPFSSKAWTDAINSIPWEDYPSLTPIEKNT